MNVTYTLKDLERDRLTLHENMEEVKNKSRGHEDIGYWPTNTYGEIKITAKYENSRVQITHTKNKDFEFFVYSENFFDVDGEHPEPRSGAVRIFPARMMMKGGMLPEAGEGIAVLKELFSEILEYGG